MSAAGPTSGVNGRLRGEVLAWCYGDAPLAHIALAGGVREILSALFSASVLGARSRVLRPRMSCSDPSD